MKNFRKILIALCLVAALVAAIAVNVLAADFAATSVSTGSETSFVDYWTVNKVRLDDMENGTSTSECAAPKGAHTAKAGTQTAMVVTEEGKGAPYIYSQPDENGVVPTSSNSYSLVNYANKVAGVNGKLYLQPRYKNLSSILGEADPKKKAADTPLNGYVMEFDIATLSGDMGSFNIQMFNSNSAGDGYLDLAKYSASDGVAVISGTSGTVESVRGGWLHVSILYNPNVEESEQLSVYVNQAQVDTKGEVERKLVYRGSNENSSGVSVYPLSLRIGAQDAESGTFAFDNLLFYQATSICNPDYMSLLTPQDLFAKYMDVLAPTEEVEPKPTDVQRYQAYETVANEYLTLFAETQDPQMLALIERYNNFYASGLDELQLGAQKENTNTFVSKVKVLKDFKRGLSNIYDRELAVDDVEQFIAEVASLIYIGTDEKTDPYHLAMKDFEVYSEYVLLDKDVRTFKNRMDRFATSDEFNSSDAMQRHYDEATALIASVEQLFEDDKNKKDDNSGDYNEGYVVSGIGLYTEAEAKLVRDAKDAYDAAEEKLGAAVKTTNSRRFIDLMKLLEGTIRSDWDADTGYMRNLWYLARGIIEGNNYDNTVSGFADSYSFYERLDAFFWAKLQDEHVETLTAKLDLFDVPGATYIDKAGICTYVDNYFTKNESDINADDTRIKTIKSRNELYKTQLSQIGIDYSALLYQQTIEFKYKMDELMTLEGYANIKPMYDEASALYYAMNVSISGLDGNSDVTNEQLKIAIANYEEIGAWLLNVETMNTAFVKAMDAVIAAANADERYAALVTCYTCEKYLDTSFEFIEEGLRYKVSVYKASYDVIKNNYESTINVSNEGAMGAIGIVCATRAYSGVDDLVKYAYVNLK